MNDDYGNNDNNLIIFNGDGIETSIVKVDKSELESNKYFRLSDEAFSKVSILLQNVPGYTAQQIAVDAANNTINNMTKDAFKVVMKDGLHLGKSHSVADAFNGNLYNENNKLVGAASWVPLDPEKISYTVSPQMILGLFTIMSFATGQFFISTINKKLSKLNENVEKILAFLELEKRSNIEADSEILNRSIAYLRFIMENDIQKYSSAVDFKAIKRHALGDIYFFGETVSKVTSRIKETSKPEEVQTIIGELKKYCPQYWHAVRNYNLAAMLEAIVSENDDPAYLDLVIEELRIQTSRYDKSIQMIKETYDKYHNESKSLNADQIFTNDFDYVRANDGRAFGVLGNPLFKVINEIDMEGAKIRKSNSENDRELFLETCGDSTPLHETIEIIKDYRKAKNTPVELLVTNEGAYINYVNQDDIGE